jgi:hypothetical protein
MEIYNMQIYIKYLPKEQLLFELWKYARISPNFYYCKDLSPVLTIEDARKDINCMLANNRDIDLTTYYGRMLFIDITGDYVDTFNYDLYNGLNKAKKIIDLLKEKELRHTLYTYYKFF